VNKVKEVYSNLINAIIESGVDNGTPKETLFSIMEDLNNKEVKELYSYVFQDFVHLVWQKMLAEVRNNEDLLHFYGASLASYIPICAALSEKYKIDNDEKMIKIFLTAVSVKIFERT
jgi:hypothetical protein